MAAPQLLGLFCDRFPTEMEFEHLLSLLAPNKRMEVKKYRLKKDACRSLLGELLLRYRLVKYWNCNNTEIDIFTSKHGKPELVWPKNSCFNISHSAHAIVAAIGDDPLGIDVEKIRPCNLSMVQSFFHPKEYLDLLEQAEEKRNNYFTLLWILKESFMKYTGLGLHTPLNSFYVGLSDQENICFESEQYTGNVILQLHPAYKGHYVATCTNSPILAEMEWTTYSAFLPNLLETLQVYEDVIACS